MATLTERPALPEVATDTSLEEATSRIPLFHVVLLDDNDHSYEYVIEMLMDLFGHNERTAYEMSCEVDAKGRVIVQTTYRERAEMRRSQIQSYGADWRIPHCKGSMSATIEPAGESGHE